MATSVRRFTVDDVRNLPEDGNHYELIDGVLYVSPGPSFGHERVRMRLLLALGRYLEGLGREETLIGGASELTWGTQDTYVDPDIWVVDPGEAEAWSWTVLRTVPLVVEVVSPTSRRRDRVIKRDLYARMGVGTYWVIDPTQRRAEEMCAGESALRLVDTLSWCAVDGAAPFEHRVSDLFRGMP